MAETKIVNASILPVDGKTAIIEGGELLIRDGKIASLGASVGAGAGADIVDAQGQVVMPGLVNTHTHSAMTLLRSYADDLPLMEWLQNKIWPVEAHLNEEDIYWGTALAAVEMLKSGTTTCSDMYFLMDNAARAYADTGIRAVIAPGLFSFAQDPAGELRKASEICRDWQGGADGRITTMLAPHAPYTCDREYLLEILDVAREIDVPIHTHLSETKGEVEESYEKLGKSPVAYLEELGILGHRHTLAAHCVHVDEEDIGILGRNRVAIAHNPQCNMKLGNGVAPVVELGAAGAVVGVATDGVASNNNLNLWEEMRMAAFLQKGYHGDTTRLPATAALEMGTRIGAAALDLAGVTGSLEVGKEADLIFVDAKQPQFQPLHDLTSNLVYSAYGSEITRVFVSGREVLRDGRLTRIDEEEIYRNARAQARRLLEAAGK